MLISGREDEEPVIELPMPKPPSLAGKGKQKGATGAAHDDNKKLAPVATGSPPSEKATDFSDEAVAQDGSNDSSRKAPQPVRSAKSLLQSASDVSTEDNDGQASQRASPDQQTDRDAEFKQRMADVDPAAIQAFQDLIQAERNTESEAASLAPSMANPLAIWREGDTPQLVMSRETSDAMSAGSSNPTSALAGQQRSLAQQLAQFVQGDRSQAQPRFEMQREKHDLPAKASQGFTHDQQAAMADFGEDEVDYMSVKEIEDRLKSMSVAEDASDQLTPKPEGIGSYGQVDPEIFAVMSRAGFSMPAELQDILLHGPQLHTARDTEAPTMTTQEAQPSIQDEDSDDEDEDTAPMTGYGGGHGVRKITLDPAALAAKQARDAQKAQSYKALAATVHAMRLAEDYSMEAFSKTLALLKLNPEYYSIWNYRRNIFLHGLFPACHGDEQAKQHLMNDELKLLQAILQDYPKVYCLWVHRKWCLAQCPWPDWQRELSLVSRMLEMDARNFHVWEYRRYVVAQLEQMQEVSMAAKEFEYTTSAISNNFSNFSAWHNRTKLISALLLEAGNGQAREAKRSEMLQEELALLKNALFTDPDDQSVWLYHRWLLNPEAGPSEQFPLAPQETVARAALLNQELGMVNELLEEEPGHVWCLDARCVYGTALLVMEQDAAERARLLKQLQNDVQEMQAARSDGHRSAPYNLLLQKAERCMGGAQATDEDEPEVVIYNDAKRSFGNALRQREIIHCSGQAFVLAAGQDQVLSVILPMKGDDAKDLTLSKAFEHFKAVEQLLSARPGANQTALRELIGLVSDGKVEYISCQPVNLA